jgi:hypothetical protein
MKRSLHITMGASAMRISSFTIVATSTLVLALPASAAGSLTRTFVSSTGVDTNPCTVTQPCATFAAAYNAVAPNGIVAALDPGKYGPLTITGPVTINGNGWAAITAPANGTGITINAVSGNVTLTGLEVDGADAAYNGIVFNSGGNLVVKNCVLKDFVIDAQNGNSGNGILIAPASGTITFTIVDTIVSNSAWAGIYYQPPSGSATATGVIDHVVATGSTYYAGIAADLYLASGGSAAISISNSVISNNTNADGVYANAAIGSIAMTLDNDEISYNTVGINNGGPAGSTMVLGRSTITNNSDLGIANFGAIGTFKNNQIYANGSGNAVGGTGLTNISLQ